MSTTTAPTTECLADLEEIDLKRVKIDPFWSRVLPAAGARRFQTIALCKIDDQVIVATCNPRLAAVRRFVTTKIKSPIQFVRADRDSMRRVLGQVHVRAEAGISDDTEDESCETVKVCSELIRAACLRGASDIHLVPSETSLECRFRVDGILETFRHIDLELQAGVASRIKVLAGLNIAEKRAPQDGRFSIAADAQLPKINVRVATIPTRYGERVTLRLLAPMHSELSLANLGMAEREMVHFSSALQSPSGLILLTGPTGSGKSTTLYTSITELMATRGGNVITVEDPIEYEIPGVTQVEVDSAEKVTFLGALRSILRHDPDIIMLGEIRDAETAELAIKASLTGHLVFSTLHTNNAAGVVTRLIDMGVQPFLVAATLRMAIAQRLVRKLCPHCRVPATLSRTEAAALGIPSAEGTGAFRSQGCVYCAGRGFIGRTAIFEMLRGGAELSDLISGGASESELHQHMQTTDACLFSDDGLQKIQAGDTTAEQIIRGVATW
ncbi:GspE/PulE family protein [Rhodopirellula bahusiensis]|uniref:Type II secretion system protein GspE n=1 Tax=Rhodopirellula bahusiensis TaxID=2014065 RepID=A0A2G1W6N0_9BACT|nr:GspE/PulE family protein [Rhodopirellula bahusiensis]PHQ34490.1 type II secretion system protein GspE [Rhodopirellula bahusiensis]